MRWGKVTIIGVGLLGGSVALALRTRKLAGLVYGYARRKTTVREALRLGAVDEAGMDLRMAVADADLIVLCTPIAQMPILVERMLPDLKRGAIVTDVGSVKAPVVRALVPPLRRAGVHFVGSHPMAGSEKGGVTAARADLFCDAVCVLTPDSRTRSTARRRVETLWQSLGCRVMDMDAGVHDKLVSRTSHLPHLLASVLTLQVLDPRADKRQAVLCATGFHHTTRVASGPPRVWRDIVMANRKNLARDLARFEGRLHQLRHMLLSDDAAGVESLLRTASERRAIWNRGAAKPGSSE